MTRTKKYIRKLLSTPLFELVSKAYDTHTQNINDTSIELCSLLSIKTGACPEDCAYCPQSAHYNTGLEKEKLLPTEIILQQAIRAKEQGAKRFCMGAAWKYPPKKEFPRVLDIVKKVKALGLETCVTLGKLNSDHTDQLKLAGLDFYNHNIDTSREHYKKIISTRNYDERIETLNNAANSGLSLCCGGILGMGENIDDRINFLWELTQLNTTPMSIPINRLINIPGTPLENCDPIDDFDFIKCIAAARILFPKTQIRLSAGRADMSNALQAWCMMAGANSIWLGDTLLVTKNANHDNDINLLKKLGLRVNAPIS
jgi:biotin synthase